MSSWEINRAVGVTQKAELARHDVAWAMQRALMEHLEKAWDQPDEGIWEVRGPRRDFT